eukprot:COSAG05_NODE_548_length_8749_cov_33.055838_11_plen_174_part_00
MDGLQQQLLLALARLRRAEARVLDPEALRAAEALEVHFSLFPDLFWTPLAHLWGTSVENTEPYPHTGGAAGGGGGGGRVDAGGRWAAGALMGGLACFACRWLASRSVFSALVLRLSLSLSCLPLALSFSFALYIPSSLLSLSLSLSLSATAFIFLSPCCPDPSPHHPIRAPHI